MPFIMNIRLEETCAHLVSKSVACVHLPSGRYRRTVKGIFFSRNSFMAIYTSIFGCSNGTLMVHVVQHRSSSTANEAKSKANGTEIYLKRISLALQLHHHRCIHAAAAHQ